LENRSGLKNSIFCKMYSIENNILKIDHKEIIFDYPVKECLEIGDMLILYLNYFDKVIPIENNVYGVSLKEGEIIWQIEKRKYPKGGYSRKRCRFIGISYRENKLRLHNWCSTNLIVEPTTGKVLEEEETR
jgi:hypothetical protein